MNKQINIREALDWYLWAGVNETCGDLPCLTGEAEKFFSQATIKSVPAQVLSGKQASGQPTGRAGNLSFSRTSQFCADGSDHAALCCCYKKCTRYLCQSIFSGRTAKHRAEF